jgi:ribosome-associated protein
VVVIKAQSSRSLEQNKTDALARLQALVDSVTALPKPRKPTRPTLASQRRRVQSKVNRSQVKALRARVSGSE